MKYFIFLIGAAVGITLLSCESMSEMQDRYSRGDVAYAPKVESLTVRGGRNRARTEVSIDSRLLESVRLFWTDNNREDSADIAVNFAPGKYSIILDNVAENDYVFKAVGIDRYKNKSLTSTTSGKVYGERYQSMLSPRTVPLANNTLRKMTIYWATAASDVFACEVKYDDRDGTEQNLLVPARTNTTDITDLRDNLRYRTLYLPENAIDTFYTAWKDIEVVSITPPPAPVGLWQFDNQSVNIGRPLLQQGSGAITPQPDGTVLVGKGAYYLCDHRMPASGGGTKVNEYTLLIDFKISQTGRYYTFLQTTLANNDDGEIFINTGGNFGISGYYTSGGPAKVDTWQRYVVTVKCGAGENGIFRQYLDGLLLNTVSAGHDAKLNIDDRFALNTSGALLFADEDGEDNDILIACVAIWDRTLTPEEVAMVGVARETIIFE